MRTFHGVTPYGYLLVCTFLLLGLQGAVPAGRVQQLLVTALAGASLMLSFYVAHASPRWMRFAVTLALAALAVSVLRALGGGPGDGTARVINATLIAFGPPAVAMGILRDLRVSSEVHMSSVAGVLALYMLLGMFFAFVYGALDRLGADPVFADGSPATVARCLYFSFVTLATVGYGDLTARSDVGHTISVLEALIGQIYLVTVVSLIVTNLRRPQR